MNKKKTSPNKRGRLAKPEQAKMEDRLKDIFLQGGITPYQAALQTGYKFDTVKKLFTKWANELVLEEKREPWLEREKRVRQRALEGLSTKLTKVRERLAQFEQTLHDIMTKGDVENDPRIELYEKIVRLNTGLAAELQQQYDAIEMTPPTEEILLQEIERLVAQRKQASSKTVRK